MEILELILGALPKSEFWRDRRVLLTGHTGFKGAWAALWLHRLGAEVTGFALPANSEPSLFEAAQIDGVLDSRIGDLRNPSEVRDAVQASAPEIVLHFAAQPIVRRAVADPIETLASNVMGTAHLLDALRDSVGLRAILVVTSDKVYRNDGSGVAFQEGDTLGGKDPYSASKAAVELVTASFRDTYFAKAGIAVGAARGGNVIGGGDFGADRIVPDCVRAALSGEALVLRDPEATRPWQHVLDCLSGYFLYAEALASAHAPPTSLNFGPPPDACPIPVRELAQVLLAAIAPATPLIVRPEVGSIEMKALAVNSSAARAALDWGDPLSGPAGLTWTAEWYNAFSLGGDARALTLDQIRSYTERATAS